MAENVTGDVYFELDGQLQEIKRQLRQPGGYPFSLENLKQGLQIIIDNDLMKIGRVLRSHFKIFLKKSGYCFSSRAQYVVKFGEPILRDIVVPAKLKDGTYCLFRFKNNGQSTEAHFHSFLGIPDSAVNAIMKDAQEMPVLEWVGLDGDINAWRLVVVGKTHKKYFEFCFENNELKVLKFTQELISRGGGRQPKF